MRCIPLTIWRNLVAIFCLTLSVSAFDYDYGDMQSNTLVTKAWEALEGKNWQAVNAYTEKCISLYYDEAVRMQSELDGMPQKENAFNYWALNDVGTCYFIKAKALVEQGQVDMAKKVSLIVLEKFPYAQCYDTRGWFWHVPKAARDVMERPSINFGDYTSQTLTLKAWNTLEKGHTDDAIAYAKKCIDLYVEDAKKQQIRLSHYASESEAFDYWALNDVGTCYFILGEAYSKNEQWELAIEAYQTCIDEYVYAQCWNPGGWFWKPASVARGRYFKIQDLYLEKVSFAQFTRAWVVT